MEEEKYDSALNDYLEGKLTGEELSRFEQRMETDSEFRSEVEGLKQVDDELKNLGAEKFSEMVSGWEDEYQNQEVAEEEAKEVSFNFRPIYAVAASIVILITAGYFLFLQPGPSSGDLYSKYYTPYEDVVLERGDEVNGLASAMNHYNQQNYTDAIPEFNKYLDKHPEEYAGWLYLGISQLETGDFEDSENSLRTAQNGPMVKDQSKWYLGLMYLKSAQTEEAVKIFQEISDDQDHYKSNQAGLLLRSLQ